MKLQGTGVQHLDHDIFSTEELKQIVNHRLSFHPGQRYPVHLLNFPTGERTKLSIDPPLWRERGLASMSESKCEAFYRTNIATAEHEERVRPPLTYCHFFAGMEGEVEFSAILFIPSADRWIEKKGETSTADEAGQSCEKTSGKVLCSGYVNTGPRSGIPCIGSPSIVFGLCGRCG